MGAISAVIQFVKINFFKFILFFVFSLLFLVVLFPYEDLSDLVTKKVAEATQNKVFIKFDTLDLTLLPIGVDLEDVEVMTRTLPALKASSLYISPSITKLLAMKYGASVKAEGFLGGEVYVNATMGVENDKKEVIHDIPVVEIENLNLEKLSELFPGFTSKIESQLNAGISDLKFEQNLKVQPSAEFNLNTNKMLLKFIEVPSPMGDMLQLQNLTFTKVSLRGRLIDGNLTLEEVNLGSGKDPMQFKIKGNVELALSKQGDAIVPVPKDYNITVKLTASDNLKDDYKFLFDSILNSPALGVSKFKASSPLTGFSEYVFKVSGTAYRGMPRTTKANF